MKIILLIIYLFSTFLLFSQVNGKIADGKGKPIVGAKVYWLGTSTAVMSDSLGMFIMPRVSDSNQLVFSSFSFKNDTVFVSQPNTNLQVVLKRPIQLSEVSVLAKNYGVIKSSGVIQTETITGAELCKAACCNLSESFETNPSVDVSYSDAATGAKQIKMLGLSGTYVQMLTENIPSLRGISAPFGLGFVPGPWMESIQVSKGTASVINGYEAITGQINVEYKKPQANEIASVSLFASDAGRFEINATANAKLSKYLSTGLLIHASDEVTARDINHDDYIDLPMVKQYNLINRWYYMKDRYVSQVFLRALSENRIGGQVTGNYHVDIDSKRYEFFAKNGYVFNYKNATSIGFIVSGSFHQEDANYGLKAYNGRQGNFYSNLIFQSNFKKFHKISTGISFNVDDYNEKLLLDKSNLYLRHEYVPGVFTEYSYNLNDKFIAFAGIRADYNSAYGTFITPRLHLKYNSSQYLNFRASAGKGYRSPNVLAESNYLLASNRILTIDPNLKMESAWNYGLSAHSFIPLGTRKLNLSAEWYYTNFENQVVVDMDSSPHAVLFFNLDGKSYANSYQLEANTQLFRGLTLTLAHRITDVKTEMWGVLREKPLTSRWKSLFTTSYQTPLRKWQFDFTAQFIGGGRMPDPQIQEEVMEADANSNSMLIWEKEFKAYTMLNAQVTKYFRTWSVYLGSENLTNFVQMNPIIDVKNPFGSNFDASMIWGPLHMRRIYIGLRWSLERDNNN